MSDDLPQDLASRLIIDLTTPLVPVRKSDIVHRPFPFMKLPFDVRLIVYEMALVTPHDQRWYHYGTKKLMAYDPAQAHGLDRRPKMAMSISMGNSPRLIDRPPLLAVSRQIRKEADKVYWAQNEWQVNVDSKDGDGCTDEDLSTPMQEFERWVSPGVVWRSVGEEANAGIPRSM